MAIEIIENAQNTVYARRSSGLEPLLWMGRCAALDRVVGAEGDMQPTYQQAVDGGLEVSGHVDSQPGGVETTVSFKESIAEQLGEELAACSWDIDRRFHCNSLGMWNAWQSILRIAVGRVTSTDEGGSTFNEDQQENVTSLPWYGEDSCWIQRVAMSIAQFGTAGCPECPIWVDAAIGNPASQVANWAATKAHLDCIIAENAGVSGDTLSTPTDTYPGGSAYWGGVLLPDGRVFLSPFEATTARIYDPATDTLTTPTGTYAGTTYAYIGSVLLPDGRVFIVPGSVTTARIYDPVTDTLVTPGGTYPSGLVNFQGAVLLADGRVFLVPSYSTSARIYDPVSDAVTTPSGTYPGGGAYSGGVLLPDGRVFCVPNSATTARIYDPATDMLTTPTETYPGSNAYLGGFLLPDGRVFCVPHNATAGRIYDPATDSVSVPTDAYPGGQAFAGGVILPSGIGFLVPYNETAARLYSISPVSGFSERYCTGPFENKF